MDALAAPSEEGAITLDRLDRMIYKEMLSSEDVLNGVSAVILSEDQQKKIRNGLPLLWPDDPMISDRFLLIYDGRIFAVAVYRDGHIFPKRILNI